MLNASGEYQIVHFKCNPVLFFSINSTYIRYKTYNFLNNRYISLNVGIHSFEVGNVVTMLITISKLLSELQDKIVIRLILKHIHAQNALWVFRDHLKHSLPKGVLSSSEHALCPFLAYVKHSQRNHIKHRWQELLPCLMRLKTTNPHVLINFLL